MRRLLLLLGLVPVLLGAPALRADDKPPPEPSKPAAAESPAEKYRALESEYRKAQEEFTKAYGAAKTDAERNQAFQQKYPRPDRFAPRFLALAEEYPNDPAAVDALVWIAVNAPVGAQGEKAIEILARDHARSEKLGPVCPRLVYADGKATETLLRAVLEKNPSHEVQGLACLSLAQYLKLHSQRPGGLMTGLQNLLKNQKAPDPKAQAEEAEKLFERVIAEYGDVKGFRGTLADQARSELFEIRNLGIGKAAPKIEGEDIGGQRFKLSDYRGKVVVLDFWGNW